MKLIQIHLYLLLKMKAPYRLYMHGNHSNSHSLLDGNIIYCSRWSGCVHIGGQVSLVQDLACTLQQSIYLAG